MRRNQLERRLLTAYREAMNQGRWDVAEHVVAAIEACVPPCALTSGALTEAYLDIAARATTQEDAPATKTSRRA